MMVKPIVLNHATSSRRSRPMSVILLLIGSLVCVALLLSLHRLNSQAATLNQDIQQLQHPNKSADSSRNRKDSAEKAEEISLARNVMAELALPWQPLFTTLERLNIPDVKLVSVEPNARQQKLRITAQATDIEIMFDYIASLQKQAIFRHVLLLTHEQIADSAMPINFVVEAAWIQ